MKKKMKKLFSKLVTLVLLVAILVPYTTIPKVEAEETCNGDWEYHTNYYFFSQAENPHAWASYLVQENADNTATTYYTSFLYNFPSDGSTMEILSADFVDLDMDGNVNEINSTSKWSVKGFYSEWLKMYDSNKVYEYANPDSTYKSYSYTATNNTGSSENDSIITYLIHGPWGFAGLNDIDTNNDIKLDNSESIISVESYREANNNSASESTILNKLVEASVIPDTNEITKLNIGVSRDLNNDGTAKNEIISAIKDYNRDKGSSTKAGIKKSDKGDVVLKLYIRRSYDTKDFFTFNNIRYNDGTFYNHNATDATTLGGLSSDYKLYFPNINGCDEHVANHSCNDYAYVTQGETGTTSVSEPTAVKLMAKGNANYWFLAPSLFQISYKVCKSATPEATEDTVSLTYKSSIDGATELPATDTKAVGSKFTVSTQEPTLSGYTFSVWSTDPECGNSGRTFEPGTTFSDNLTSSQTLYACWGPVGGEQQKDTGVLTYAGLFTGIIALAGGSYYLIKKKNVFKKI